MYLTFYRRTNVHQYSFEDSFRAITDNTPLPVDVPLAYPRTHTVSMTEGTNVDRLLVGKILREVSALNRSVHSIPRDYTTFAIPKASGGVRRIDAPNDTLKEYQSQITKFLGETCRILSHDAAFAYIPKRCAKHALERHINNRWFLKLDIKDFFPSCTSEVVHNALQQLHPIARQYANMRSIGWDQVLETCFLNGVLPQGSPASPMLSNLVMVQFDYAINNLLRDFDRHNFVYTRYADDMLISAPHDFDSIKVANAVQEILAGTFALNTTKTRYGSSAGRNWNLGLMLNKDQQITVGHKRKERTKAMMFSLMMLPNGRTLEELQVLQGEFAYVETIEPRYMRELDLKYQNKLHVESYKTTLQKLIKEWNTPAVF